MKKIFASLGFCSAFVHRFCGFDAGNLQDRVDAAKIVLDQIMAAGDKGIPMNIMEQATAWAWFPG